MLIDSDNVDSAGSSGKPDDADRAESTDKSNHADNVFQTVDQVSQTSKCQTEDNSENTNNCSIQLFFVASAPLYYFLFRLSWRTICEDFDIYLSRLAYFD